MRRASRASSWARLDGRRRSHAWKPERDTSSTRHMSETGWLTLSAAMNRNTVTASRCPWRRRPRLKRKSRSSGGHLLERDGVPEAFELGDEPAGAAFGVAADEEVCAGVAVGLAAGEHVPGRDEDRVGDGDRGAVAAAAGSEPVILGAHVGVAGTGGGLGR